MANGASGGQQVGYSTIARVQRAGMWSETARRWVNLDPLWKSGAITGISFCEKVGNELHRLLRVRSQEDIAPLQ